MTAPMPSHAPCVQFENLKAPAVIILLAVCFVVLGCCYLAGEHFLAKPRTFQVAKCENFE